MPGPTYPPIPRDMLTLEVARLRELLALDEDGERLEVKPLPILDLGPSPVLTAALNTFFAERGLLTIGPDWRGAGWNELTHEEAVRSLTYLLSQGMAYGTPRREFAAAREGAIAFLSLFGSESRLLSNTDMDRSLLPDGSVPPSGWGYGSGRSLTPATFDAGVVAVGAGRMGLLWFTDED